MKSAPVFVAGHRGLVGSALCRELERSGYTNLLKLTRQELDLRNQSAVRAFFDEARPQVVYMAAARVGGIQANNSARWEFLLHNLEIQNNVLGCALEFETEKVAFFGSSCIYPRLAPQPITEDSLLTGELEPTNEPYAVAKIAGLKLVEAANTEYHRRWLTLMPTNMYGPNDNFDPVTSHVLPGLIHKFHEAKMRHRAGDDSGVELWGTGSPLREFLHVDDLARAAVHLVEHGHTGNYNVGYGDEITIRDLAAKIAAIIGYEGPIHWNASKPDGTPRKLLDSSRIRATGWAPRIGLDDGIRSTYECYLREREG